jgi:hypothetical protein
MRRRLEDIDLINVALWLIQAEIIILVGWGTIAAILDNPYSRTQ